MVAALTRALTLLHAPPGTGIEAVIAVMGTLAAARGTRVMLAATTDEAVAEALRWAVDGGVAADRVVHLKAVPDEGEEEVAELLQRHAPALVAEPASV